MTSLREIIVKTDFVQEVMKTLAEGRTVVITPRTYLNSPAIDIAVRVLGKEQADRHRERLIRAADIYEMGTDAALVNALQRLRYELNK